MTKKKQNILLHISWLEHLHNFFYTLINFLKKHHIALFDVVKECDISSSSDASIKNVIPNNLKPILKNSNIKTIFTTGTKAHELYKKYIYPKRTKELSKLNSPWSSPSKFPAS